MRRKQLGTAAAGAPAAYVSSGLTLLAASFAGLEAGLLGVFHVGLLGAIFYLLARAFPGLSPASRAGPGSPCSNAPGAARRGGTSARGCRPSPRCPSIPWRTAGGARRGRDIYWV